MSDYLIFLMEFVEREILCGATDAEFERHLGLFIATEKAVRYPHFSNDYARDVLRNMWCVYRNENANDFFDFSGFMESAYGEAWRYEACLNEAYGTV